MALGIDECQFTRHNTKRTGEEERKQEDIHAQYESGVLKLSIPKMEQKKPQVEEKKYIAIEG